MIAAALRRYLDENKAKYNVQSCEPRPTAQELAHLAHVSGKRLAKTVLLREQGSQQHILAVVPASELVDLNRLSAQWGKPLELAPEEDFAKLLPDFETAAAPPFAGLVGLPTLVDDCLAGRDWIAFCGGSRGDLIEMSWDEYARIAQPRLFSEIGIPG